MLAYCLHPDALVRRRTVWLLALVTGKETITEESGRHERKTVVNLEA